jgi:ribonucleoside-diphosphate reductase alpha chain
MHLNLEQDLALKRQASAPKERRPNYPWREIVRDRAPLLPDVEVLCPQGPEPFDLGEIADTVGRSLAAVLMVRGESDIFTTERKEFVFRIVEEVARNLSVLALRQRPLRLNLKELYVLIEQTLVDHRAYDVARSLLHLHSAKLGADRISSALPVRLVRRNGQVVPWSETKIEIAIRKAFLALELNPAPALEIARTVSARALATREPFLKIEEVQDIVQEELMRAGYFKVAEAFILYRAMRAAVRGTEAAHSTNAHSQPTMVVVVRQPGDTTLWDGHDLRLRIEYAATGLALPLSTEEIENELRRSIYDNITGADLAQTIARNARTLLERDADFTRFAARLQLTYLYEETLGWDIVRDGVGRLCEYHARAFPEYVRTAVALGLLRPELATAFSLEELARALDPAADLSLDLAGVELLVERFLLRVRKDGTKGRHLEVPQFLWMRVAMGLALAERSEARTAHCLEFYRAMESRRFLPAASVLVHAGTPGSQLISHYGIHCDNRLESVMQRMVADGAYLAVQGGAVSSCWTAVHGNAPGQGERPSPGLAACLDMHNAMLAAVGPVDGRAYLESWHAELPALLARRRSAVLPLAHWVPDLLVRRAVAGADWTFFRPSDVADLSGLYGDAFARRYEEYEVQAAQGRLWHSRMPAASLWRDLVRTVLEDAASVVFKDACLLRSSQDHVGPVRSAGASTAFPLAAADSETTASATGAVAIDAHLDSTGRLDLEALRQSVRVAVRALDNVLELHHFPTDSGREAARRHRPLGLGMMGLARALQLKGLGFTSPAGCQFGDECTEALAHSALQASAELAAERGVYPSFKGSKWDHGVLPVETLTGLEQERGVGIEVPTAGALDWEPLRRIVATHGIRHSALLGFGQAHELAELAGTTPGIDPVERNIEVQSTLSGEFVALAPGLQRDLKAGGLWSREVIEQLKYFDGDLQEIADIPAEIKARHVTASDLAPVDVIQAAARRQKWIDQAQALRLVLPRPHTGIGELSALLLAAWRLGLKSVWQVVPARMVRPVVG